VLLQPRLWGPFSPPAGSPRPASGFPCASPLRAPGAKQLTDQGLFRSVQLCAEKRNASRDGPGWGFLGGSRVRSSAAGARPFFRPCPRGRGDPRPVYRCDKPNLQLGQRRCFSFGGKRIDATIAAEMLRAVAPIAIEAAAEAERMLRDEDKDRRRIAELELQQAHYDASLAERRYAACDPDNRLIAAQLWEAALQRVETCRQRLGGMPEPDAGAAADDDDGLAEQLRFALGGYSSDCGGHDSSGGARAASGHATAPPRSDMNSRRLLRNWTRCFMRQL